MAIKEPIPFKQILTVVKTLTPAQKERLRAELEENGKSPIKPFSFTELLLKGPVFTKKQIKKIKENSKSIAAWRTKK